MKKSAIMLGLILATILPTALWADDEPIQGPVTTSTTGSNAPSETSSGELITVSLSPLLGVPVSGNTARETTRAVEGRLILVSKPIKIFYSALTLGFRTTPLT